MTDFETHFLSTSQGKFLLAPRTIRLGQINMRAITYYLGEKTKLSRDILLCSVPKLTCQGGQAENKRPVEKMIRRNKDGYK